MRKVLLGAALALAAPAALNVAPALAAAPDGPGPWADSVVSVNQGLQKDGNPVPVNRSDPAAALGVAERPANTNAAPPGTFFSLGFGGRIELGFDNRICNQPGDDLDIELVEATAEPYPPELVDVYVSQDGSSYTLAASDVNKDATIGLPDGMSFARFVKLIDKTVPENHGAGADGYDVDGVQALAPSSECEPPPEPDGKIFGGGITKFDKKWTKYGWKYQTLVHAVKIYCRPNRGTDFLLANWGKNIFVLKQVTERKCTDDPTIDPSPPAASFDTVTGKGTGYLNGKPATVEFVLNDAGEPGQNDRVKLVIKDKYGNVVLNVDEKIDCGNHQAINLS